MPTRSPDAMDLSRRESPVAKGFHKPLSAHERQSLPRDDFALPGKGTGPKGAGAGSYPIPDASHARNALARVAQHGSPAEQAAVRRKVQSKVPAIGSKRADHRYRDRRA